MPPILDVTIGVLFVFLLFSLVVTAANEIWLSFLDKRAAFLKEGLQELFRDSSGSTNAIKADDILQHGLISSLSRGKFNSADNCTAGVPSYIPGKSFVLALLSEIQKKAAAAEVAANDLRGGIAKLENQELKQTLLALYDDAQGDLIHLKGNIENWFNESMDRVSGWYTRYAKQWLLILGFTLAALGNVDTIHIAQVLAEPESETLRKAVVEQATTYARTEANRPVGSKPTEVEPVNGVPASPAGDNTEAKNEIQHFKEALADLEGTSLPMGWDEQQQRYFKDHWFTVIAGWLLTALAASMGAPFWFDTLNRFIDIRSSGRAPEERDPTATKKQSSGIETYVVTGDSLRVSGASSQPVLQPGTLYNRPSPQGPENPEA